MSVPVRPSAAPAHELQYRAVTADELPACAEIWRASINDYIRPLGQVDVPLETGPLIRLYTHLHATDPERFIAAVGPDPALESGERIVGFAAAARRERLWFLSMLFVLPEVQGAGVDSREVTPGTTLRSL